RQRCGSTKFATVLEADALRRRQHPSHHSRTRRIDRTLGRGIVGCSVLTELYDVRYQHTPVDEDLAVASGHRRRWGETAQFGQSLLLDSNSMWNDTHGLLL